MGRIQWDDSLSVGVDEIDTQHKRLIDLHNRVHECILGVKGEDCDTVTKEAINEMMAYADYHFNCEREYMEKICYPAIVAHLRCHSTFEDEIYQHFRAAINGQYILPTEVIKLIKKWFHDHITTEDRKLGEYLRNNDEK